MKKNIVLVTGATLAATTGFALAGTFTIDLTGVESHGNFGDAANEFIITDIGVGSEVVGLEWIDVVGTGGGGPSWGNEMNMYIEAGSVATGSGGSNTGFFPDEGSATAGGTWGPASGGSSTYLIDNGNNFVSVDGDIRIEFYESYDDGNVLPHDSEYVGGSVIITYTEIPAPGALALLGLAGIAGTRRRRA
jgi:uncharacterized protein (TIGR03382 family)